MLIFGNGMNQEVILTTHIGKVPTDADIAAVVTRASLCAANGLELDACLKILGRPGTKEDRHVFVAPDTTEIILNWR